MIGAQGTGHRESIRIASETGRNNARGPRRLGRDHAAQALLHRLGTFQTSVRRRAPLNNFDIDQLVTKQITFRGMRGHSFQAVELALRTMEEGKFPLERMTTHLMGLHEVDAALRMVGGQTEERSIHISVDPWKT